MRVENPRLYIQPPLVTDVEAPVEDGSVGLQDWVLVGQDLRSRLFVGVVQEVAVKVLLENLDIFYILIRAIPFGACKVLQLGVSHRPASSPACA